MSTLTEQLKWLKKNFGLYYGEPSQEVLKKFDEALVETERLEGENKKLQKQSDLLTLGLLQEKNKNKRLRDTLESNKANSYPGLAVKEGELLNRIYRNTTETLKESKE